MDFPKFFPLTRVNEFIDSARWRGLAVLTAEKNGPLTEDHVKAITGSPCNDREVGMHVLTKPMLCEFANSASTDDVLVIAKPGVRFFVHSVTISVLVTAEATTSVFVGGTCAGSVKRLNSIKTVPSVAAAYFGSCVLDVLLDENTNITIGASGAGPTNYHAMASYCEVGAK